MATLMIIRAWAVLLQWSGTGYDEVARRLPNGGPERASATGSISGQCILVGR
jgi:hypothetical protein